MPHTGNQHMDRPTNPILSLTYTLLVSLITWFDQANIESIARIIMYLSAAALSIMTMYYMRRDKKRKESAKKDS